MSALKGSAGAILWDSSENFKEEDLCKSMQQYLTQTLGPFVQALTNFLKNCSREHCSNQGRCVEKHVTILPSDISSHMLHTVGQLLIVSRDFLLRQYSWLYPWYNLTRSNMSVSEILQNNAYTCQCYPGWSGNSCNLTSEIWSSLNRLSNRFLLKKEKKKKISHWTLKMLIWENT